MFRDALATDGLFDELWSELTMFIVAVRSFERVGHGVEDICRALEDVVHLLKRTVTGFWEEKVHNGEDKCVASTLSVHAPRLSGGQVGVAILHDSEDDIGLVSNTIKCHGSNHDDHEVKDPVGARSKPVRTSQELHGMQELIYLVDSALVGARIRSGTISAGYNHVIPSQPMAKKVLNTKRKTACAIPAWLSPSSSNR